MFACTCTIVHTCGLGPPFMAHYARLNRFVASSELTLNKGVAGYLNRNVAGEGCLVRPQPCPAFVPRLERYDSQRQTYLDEPRPPTKAGANPAHKVANYRHVPTNLPRYGKTSCRTATKELAAL